MYRLFYSLLIVLFIFVSTGCEDGKPTSQMMGEVVDMMVDESIDTDTTKPVDQTYVPEPEPEPDIPEDFNLNVQRITVKQVGRRWLGIDDPKKRGITDIIPAEAAIVMKLDGEGNIEERKSNRLLILPPNTPAFDGYHYLTFYDDNGKDTILEGDVLEVIQDDILPQETIHTRVGRIYYRIISNITRPEIDYSDFWDDE